MKDYTEEDAELDAILDDMEREHTYGRGVELEIAELKRRLAEQDKTIAELTKRAQPPPHGDPNAPPQQPVDPAILAWARENPWFYHDEELHGAAIAIEQTLVRKIPDLKARLAKVKEKLMSTFPHKFDNPARRQAPTVGQPGPQTAGGMRRKKEPTLADLNDDERAALAAIKKVDPKFTDETYIRIWKTRRDANEGRLTR